MKPRQPIARIGKKKLARLGGKIPFSSIPRDPASPRKAVRKSNPIAKAKRKAGYRKMLSGKEYKAARKEAMERAENRCERDIVYRAESYGGPISYLIRCSVTTALQAHHLRYPKTRPLAASDLQILCTTHHEQAESLKPHKTRMF